MAWRDFKKYWAPVALYAGFIFYVSSIPSPAPAVMVDISALHIPMFFFLSYLMARAMQKGAKSSELTSVAVAVILTAAYGVLDEFHQLYVPGRTFSYIDIMFDVLGGCLIVFKPWWEKLFEKVYL